METDIFWHSAQSNEIKIWRIGTNHQVFGDSPDLLGTDNKLKSVAPPWSIVGVSGAGILGTNLVLQNAITGGVAIWTVNGNVVLNGQFVVDEAVPCPCSKTYPIREWGHPRPRRSAEVGSLSVLGIRSP
jgi:hypothetical protein